MIEKLLKEIRENWYDKFNEVIEREQRDQEEYEYNDKGELVLKDDIAKNK